MTKVQKNNIFSTESKNQNLYKYTEHEFRQ